MPISYQEAQAILSSTAAEHSLSFRHLSEDVPIIQAVGRTSNARVISPISTPPFDTSAMDGYALSSRETSNASPTDPVILCIKGTMAAGDRPMSVRSGPSDTHPPCTEIMTGSQFPIPTKHQPFDACVRLEDTVSVIGCGIAKAHVLLTAPVRQNSNRRFAGSDIRSGAIVVEENEIVQTSHVLALASLGITHVSVNRKPRVALWSTGSELVPHNAAGSHDHRIRDSNGPFVAASLRCWGVEVDELGIVEDNTDDVIRALKKRLLSTKYDLLITTGAVSVGKFDVVPLSLQRLGAEVRFHKVAMRPGAPVMFATFPPTYTECIPDIQRKPSDFSPTTKPITAFFGLPGNPMATAIGLRFFLIPYLRQLTGQGPEAPLYARLVAPKAQSYSKPAALDVFRHGTMAYTLDGVEVRLNEDQSASKVGPLLNANCWVYLRTEVEAVETGEMVSCYRLDL